MGSLGKEKLRRPYQPTGSDVPPVRATSWFRLQYELVEKEGITYIAATDKPFDPQNGWYQPLDYASPKQQPTWPEEWEGWLHLHLARLKAGNSEEVLQFVNRWGLLGLWNVRDYKDWSPWGESETYQVKGKKGVYEAYFSRHYVNPVYEGRREPEYKLHWYREPLEAFRWAVEEFQRFVALAHGEKPEGYPYAPKTPQDRKSEAQDILNRYLADCSPVTWYIARPKEEWVTFWRAPSLLHCCYLLVWLDLTALREYRRCLHQRCGGFFIPTRSNEDYCSVRCYENAKRLRNYYRKRENEHT